MYSIIVVYVVKNVEKISSYDFTYVFWCILQSAQRRIRTMVMAASAQASGARTQRGGAHRQEAPQ